MNPKVSTDIELSDTEGVNEVDQCQEYLVNVIDLIPSTEVSIDLPPLEWTFLTEPEIDVEEINMDTNQQYVGPVPCESTDLNKLFQIQYPQPINGWFVIPSFQNGFLQLCTCKYIVL